MPVRTTPLAFWPLAALFALSGAGALVVETTWMRWLRDLLGATAPATAATTAAFFAGGALGAFLGGRLARHLPDAGRALQAYAWIEIGVVAGALATPLALAAGDLWMGAVYETLVAHPAGLWSARFAVALAATLPAAVAYGATFPVMGAAAVPSPSAMGTRATLLYAVNTAGAALGTGLAAWALPGQLGVDGTYAVGVGLAAGAAAGAFALARRVGATATPPRGRPGANAPAHRAPPVALVMAALSGFAALAAQVLLVQSFAQVVNQSVVAFAAVLTTLLLLLAVGAAGVAGLRSRDAARPHAILAVAWIGSALGFAAFPRLLFAATDGFAFVGAGGGGLAYAVAVFATVAVTAGPALLAAAFVWPATLALAAEEPGDAAGPDHAASGGAAAGARIGGLAAANTLGALVGAGLAPFVLLPLFGLWGAFLALSGVCAAAALGATALLGSRRALALLALMGGGLAVLGLARPLSLPLTRTAPGERLIDQQSGASGVVSVVERRGERLVRIDNHYALGGTAERVHEERQGHIPLLLHGAPGRVAFVGTATGITAGAALAHGVAHVELIEIVPAVARAAARHFGDANRGVYDDPRSRVVLDDARNYWRHGPGGFDVVVADLFVPWRSGTGGLYTREHFAAIRERLAPGGLFCQWLPLYQLSDDEVSVIAATFGDVFPVAAVFRGDFFGAFPIVALVGWRDRPAPPDRVESAVRRLARAGVTDRWVTDPVAFWSLYLAPAPRDPEAAVPRNLDAWPRIELMAARRHAGGDRGKLDPLVGLAWSARALAWQRAAPVPDPLYPGLAPPAMEARRGGDALALAGALFSSGRETEAARALAVAADRLPARVLRDAPPDPSAAEVWFDDAR